MDALAIWGGITGTIAVVIALRREWLSSRRRLAVAPGVNFNISRTDPGEVTHAWAFITFWNSGGRALSVERAGFRYHVGQWEGEKLLQMHEHVAAIPLDEPIELPVDGPSRRVSTPLGALLASGVDAFSPIEAFAVTTADRQWLSPPRALIRGVPPATTKQQLDAGLNKLTEEAELPPAADWLVWLPREDPFLPEP
jgi:hypothetical protein